MLNNKTIAVVIPAYNVDSQIKMVIDTIPAFVDRIVVVNDSSKDKTEDIVRSYLNEKNQSEVKLNSALERIPETKFNRAEVLLIENQKNELKKFPPSVVVNTSQDSCRIILINMKKNAGVGAAVARGLKWCKDQNIDCTAVMDGDGQMDPDELESICRPIIDEGIDFVKGNRLIHRSAMLVIPFIRYFGNSILSILTKIASGYWHISDTQTGYKAISQKALYSINLWKLYKRYGYPNDLLVKLNIAFCTIKEVEIKPVYNVGEKTNMKILKVIPTISWLLIISFFKRIWIKYFFRDFHPLFLLYNLGFFLGALAIPYLYKIVVIIIFNIDTHSSVLIPLMFLSISSFQAILFAMLMDIQDNERLYKS